MKLFLQIEFAQRNQGGFGNKMLSYASSLASDILGTDLDSQSEPMIAEMVVRMIRQSEKIFLFVEVIDPNLPLGVASKVFEELEKVEAKIETAVLCGDHRSAELKMAAFGNRFVREHDSAKIKVLIERFSRAGTSASA